MGNSNEYMKEYMARRRAERRAKLIELAGNKCKVCGKNDGLEFNHKNRTEKEFVLSGKALDKSWQKILDEFAKCELLCRQHHLEYTRNQWDSGELISSQKGKAKDYPHGTANRYHYQKCRCERCKMAKKIYRAGNCKGTDIVA